MFVYTTLEQIRRTSSSMKCKSSPILQLLARHLPQGRTAKVQTIQQQPTIGTPTTTRTTMAGHRRQMQTHKVLGDRFLARMPLLLASGFLQTRVKLTFCYETLTFKARPTPQQISTLLALVPCGLCVSRTERCLSGGAQRLHALTKPILVPF